MESTAFEHAGQRIETLIQSLEGLPDPAAREIAKELLQIVLDLHGSGLARILTLASEAGATGRSLVDALAKDDQVRGLLLLHGLHPDDAETRVRQALKGVLPHLRTQGIGVTLMGIDQNIVRLKLEGPRPGGSTAIMTLRRLVEEAILSQAPDMEGVEIDGVTIRCVQEVVPIPNPPKGVAKPRQEAGSNTLDSTTSERVRLK